MARPVSVAVRYWLEPNSEPSLSKVLEGSQPARIGLPEGTEPVKPQAGDYSYSGMHDQGTLPPPKEGGLMAILIANVAEAKALNNEYLTSVIEAEKAEQQHQDKRAKTSKG